MHITVNQRGLRGGLAIAALAIGAACFFAVDRYKYEIGYNPITKSCVAYDVQKGPSYTKEWVISHNSGGMRLGYNLSEKHIRSIEGNLLFKPGVSQWSNFREKTTVKIVNGYSVVSKPSSGDISSAFLKLYGPSRVVFSAVSSDVFSEDRGAAYISSSFDGSSKIPYDGYYSYFGKPTLYFKTKGKICGSREYMAYGDYDSIYRGVLRIYRFGRHIPYVLIKQHGNITTISIS